MNFVMKIHIHNEFPVLIRYSRFGVFFKGFLAPWANFSAWSQAGLHFRYNERLQFDQCDSNIRSAVYQKNLPNKTRKGKSTQNKFLKEHINERTEIIFI